jgi:hypothetical protein
MQRKDTNIDLIRKEFEKIIDGIEIKSFEQQAIHDVERSIHLELLHLGNILLQHYTAKVIKQNKEKNKERAKEGLKNCGQVKRTLLTIFGIIEILRPKYYDTINKRVVYPFDIEYKISGSKFSYTLQDLIGKSATVNTFDESVSDINRIFELELVAMQSKRIANQLSGNVEPYYKQKDYSKQIEGEYFAAGFDDKGVPIIAGNLGREAESNGVRLGKGQKRDTKRHSTVSVTYSFNERYRTADDVIASLFKENKKQKIEPIEKQTTAQHKHIRAFMGDKERAMEYGLTQILRRNGGSTKPIVILIDGDRGLEHAVNRVIERLGISKRIEAKILDIIHVTEYLWKAANAHFGEKSKERESWVKQQCKLLLESQTELVIKTITEMSEEHKETVSKIEILEKVIKYFTNHSHMMDYATYLKKGFPISTGAIESACGHFVQTRMERNGMHWTSDGAQSMLDLRAINKNNDWEDYMQFSIATDYQYAA